MNILFMCVANSIRSQMAEGLARIIFAESAKIQSAGHFSSHLHPMVIRVMREIGIDIEDQVSKSVESLDQSKIDIVVTLCRENVCPSTLSKAKRYDWPMPDPSAPSGEEERLKAFRALRDDLQTKIEKLKSDLRI